MASALPNTYDALPYESQFDITSHPDRLATMAVLHGLKPPPVERCRVLEIGCADGGNLLPMAQALPDARFVGIDLSPRQVAGGQRLIKELGLTNVDLRAMSVMDVDDAFGVFDYVICRGVYSWVPAEGRDKILAICARNLDPNGVAYVSYNCYPGWHLRGMVREMLLYHVGQFAEPQERVRHARALLNFLGQSATPAEGGYAHVLRDEAALVQGKRDAYVLHDHLEEVNHAVYFHEFVAHAARARLTYLAPARFSIHEANLPAEVKQAVAHLSGDRVRREQYLDFVQDRSFRQSLLCHEAVQPSETPRPEALRHLRMSALARPESSSPYVRSEAPEAFVSVYGDRLSVPRPSLKAALVALFERWPTSATLDELREECRSRLGRLDSALDDLELALLQGHVVNLVDLGTIEPRFAREPGARPRAGAVARLQASQGARVISLRLRDTPLADLDRMVLPLLDGTRDRAALVEALAARVAEGALQIHDAGQPVTDPQRTRALLAGALEPSLQRLAEQALLLAEGGASS